MHGRDTGGTGDRKVVLPVLAFVLALAGGPAGAANGDLLRVGEAVAGEAEIADVARDASDGTFWVLGADGSTSANHRIYHVGAELDELLKTIENPHPAGSIATGDLTTHRGLAYRSLSSSLLVLSRVGPRLEQRFVLREVRPDGTVVESGMAVVDVEPDAEVSLFGLAYDLFGRDLWSLDAPGDRVLRLSSSGEVLESQDLPRTAPAGADLLGAGVAFGLDGTEGRLYVPVGDVFDPAPAKVFELAREGRADGDGGLQAVPTGVEVPLARLDGATVRGLEVSETARGSRSVVLAGEGGRLFEVAIAPSDPLPPRAVTCSLTTRNTVRLAWEGQGSGPEGAYGDSVQVLRNGVPLTTLEGDAVSYVDTTPVEGPSRYAVRGSETAEGGWSDASCPCRVTVGPGGLVDWTPLSRSAPFDVTEDPRTGDVWVSFPASGTLQRLDSELEAMEEIAAPFDSPGGITYVPVITLGFPPQPFEDLIAVAETRGSRVRLIPADDPAGDPLTTLTLRLDGVETPRIGGLAYMPSTETFFAVERSRREIYSLTTSGSTLNRCEPIFVDEGLEWGLSFDPIQQAFLANFEDGQVREVFAQGNCTLSGFDFSLAALGPRFDAPDFAGGLQISGNTLLVAGRSSDAVFRVLVFPFSPDFIRGDFDGDGSVNVTDARNLAEYLFLEGPAPLCADAGDLNDDGILDVSDPVFLLFSLFVPDSPSPPPPFPDPGSDPTFRDNIGCAE